MFLPTDMGSGFSLRVVGERHDNEDGSSRQAELQRCKEGEEVELLREPRNPHDPSAVAVISARGVKIGYLGADRCGWVGSKIDRGFGIAASIGRIARDPRTGALGAVLTVSMVPSQDER